MLRMGRPTRPTRIRATLQLSVQGYRRFLLPWSLHAATQQVARPNMTSRTVRDSTRQLRKCFAEPLSRSRSQSRRANRTPCAKKPTMADAGESGAKGPQDPAVIPRDGQAEPAPGTQPPGHHIQRTPPHQQPGQSPHVSPAPPAVNPVDMTDYLVRLKALEDKMEKAHKSKSRSTSRSSKSRDAKSRSSRPRSGSSSRHGSRRQDRPRRLSSRSRTSRRSYDRSTRSRSSSQRRRRSRSHRRSRTTSRRRSRTRSRSHHRKSRSGSRASSHTSRRARSTSRRKRSGSPRKIRSEPSARRDADRAIAAQFPRMGSPTGRPLPTRRATLEPYKRLPPDLKKKADQRRSRRDLTLPEHVCGYLFMVMKSVDPASEIYTALEHIAQVAHDAATIQWHVVRSWSQACLAHLEDKTATWQDTSIFDRERMGLCWCKGRSLPDVVIPCPHYNTQKCDDPASHSAEGRTWLHQCAVCYYGISERHQTSHGAQGCRKKPGLKLISDDGRPDNRRRTGQAQQKRDTAREPSKPKN